MLKSDARRGDTVDDDDKSDIDADATSAVAEARAEEAKAVGGQMGSVADQPADSDADEAGEAKTVGAKKQSAQAQGRRISMSLRTLLQGMLIAALLAAVGVMTWLYIGEKAKVDQQARQAANDRHAEQVALDYAVGAAKINYQDLNPWKNDLVKGTTAELTAKLKDAGTSMEQLLVPLQWNSTATPLVAKVRSDTNGIYVVDAFVGVVTKTIQAPDGLQSTATYSITVDSNHNWQISEVGGIGSVLGQK